MLIKAGLAATAALIAAVSLYQVDFRQLYDEMYPVNGLRRDVLNLCHEAEPTFVRAVESNRVYCYDSMPDPVERAIGWVRTSSRLAALRRPTPVETAEKMLISAVSQGHLERLAQPVQFTGYAAASGGAMTACSETAEGLPPASTIAALGVTDERFARRIAQADGTVLAAMLGLPQTERRLAPKPELPVLSLVGAGDDAAASGAAAAVSPIPAAGVARDGAARLLSVAVSGCRTRA